MARERVRVVAAPAVAAHTDAAGGTGEFSAAIRLAGATLDERTPSLTIEVQPPSHSLDEPMLLVLTLGLLPHRSRGWRRYEWRLVAVDGRQISGDAEMTSPSWVGWLVGPIALLPGWKLSATWDKVSREQERHSTARRERLALELARSIVRLRGAE